jgi:hypothetical protein
MKSVVITSILGLSLTLPIRAGAQAQPAAPAPQEQPAVPAPQAQPAPQTQLLPPSQVPPAPAASQTQPQTRALQPLAAPLAVATTDAMPDQKSPSAARTWALTGTLLGAGLLTTGIVGDQGELALMGLIGITIGPSFGHFYAGDNGQAWGQIGLRVGAMGVMFAGALSALFDCGLFGDSECEPSVITNVLLGGGLVLASGSAVYSVYDAPRAARRHNARQQRLMLMPAPITGPDRTSGLGLQLGGSF